MVALEAVQQSSDDPVQKSERAHLEASGGGGARKAQATDRGAPRRIRARRARIRPGLAATRVLRRFSARSS